jgi:hypothetical protein
MTIAHPAIESGHAPVNGIRMYYEAVVKLVHGLEPTENSPHGLAEGREERDSRPARRRVA